MMSVVRGPGGGQGLRFAGPPAGPPWPALIPAEASHGQEAWAVREERVGQKEWARDSLR